MGTLMAKTLHAIFQAIANVQNEQELKLALMDTIGDHFAVQHWGIDLLILKFKFPKFPLSV